MDTMLELMLTAGFVAPLTALLVAMAARLATALKRFTFKGRPTVATELPSVTICIPARNETHALVECLERVLASDYQKIEVIVFDDHSTDDTSLIVRSFAHAGVRFVPGIALPEGWLGKNHALSILAREASGSKLIFLDVDTKVGPTTISQLVSYSVAESADMVSVLPLQRSAWNVGTLMTPLRYLWEMLFASRHLPATTSAIWLIDADVLRDECGGLAPYAGDVRPEQRIAEKLGAQRYRFLIATAALDVYQEKKWTSQLETSRRLLYPMVGTTIVAAVAAALLLILLMAPLIGMLMGLYSGDVVVALLFGSLLMAFSMLYAWYIARIRGGYSWVAGVLLWPILLVQEMILLAASAAGYMTRTITWKGRLVTAPVVQDDYIEIDK